jgi:hypothetical protein
MEKLFFRNGMERPVGMHTCGVERVWGLVREGKRSIRDVWRKCKGRVRKDNSKERVGEWKGSGEGMRREREMGGRRREK